MVYLVISTQFGNIPDVAFEDVKQLRARQQAGSVALPMPSFVSSVSSSVNSNSAHIDSISIQTRPTVRDISVNNSSSLGRSRSLASNSTNRPSINSISTNLNKSPSQLPLFTINKQTFITPGVRFGVNRSLNNGISNNTSLPPVSSTLSNSYIGNRNLLTNTSPNIKSRPTNNRYPHHPLTVAVNSTTITTDNDEQRASYATTCSTSFFKPLVP